MPLNGVKTEQALYASKLLKGTFMIITEEDRKSMEALENAKKTRIEKDLKTNAENQDRVDPVQDKVDADPKDGVKPDRGDKAEAKESRTIQRMEKRIHQLTAELKAIKAEKETEKVLSKEESELQGIKANYADETQRLRELRRQRLKLGNDEDSEDKLIDLEMEIDKSILILNKLERRAEQLTEKTDKQKVTKKDEASIKRWNNGFMRAVKRWPELMDDEGQINQESPIWQKAVELLEDEAEPAEFIKGLHKYINPIYDHPNGVFDAVRDAVDILRDEGTRIKKVHENARREKEDEENKEEDQLLSLDRKGGQTVDTDELAVGKMRELALKKGPGSPEWMKYYKTIRPKYDKPLMPLRPTFGR